MKQKIIKLPKHLVENKSRLFLLRKWATSLRAFYGLPIWLCGSALVECNVEPRDWDIRIEMPDKEFEVRFGNPEQWYSDGVTGNYTQVRWRWAAECVKRTKEGWGATMLNIDFQIYPKSHCHAVGYKYQPKARLDKR